ncbi:MAG: hypothetical protein ABIQ12_00520, partial [Opitutaceae bacterium]
MKLLRSLFIAAVFAAVLSAAESSWRTVAQMPADNHDLTAAVVGGKFYVAGGETKDFKGTGKTHSFDEIWALDPRDWSWRAVAKFARPRIYCATAAFENRVWVIGGDIRHEDNQRRPSAIVEIYDPANGTLTRGP